MDKKTVLAIISDFRKAIESAGVKPQKILLYGSFATGNYRPDSDIDLVVISENFEGKSYWERIDVLSGAIYEVFQPIEAIAMTPKEWEDSDSLIADYAKDGEVVYG
jgi:predicted nucleotidyltransferase